MRRLARVRGDGPRSGSIGCVDRLARLERTVCRLRLWLLVALGVLILVVGIAIGAGGARREAMRGGGPGRPGMPGPGPQAMPMHQGPMGQPAGGHGAGGQ